MLIGPLGFAARSLHRRGFHAFLAFLGLTLTVASATFVLLLGEGIAGKLNIGIYPRTTFGIAWLFSAYLLLSLVFVLIVGLLSASYLVASMTNQRMRDIAVVKAAGALPRLLFSYALAEPLVIFSSSCLAGTLTALLVYISWTQSFQLTRTNGFIIVGVPGTSFLLSYLTARFQIGKIVKANTISAVSSQLSILDLKTVGKPLRVRRFGSAFNLATRTLSRDRQFTRTALRITICIFLTMVVLTSAFVLWDTSKGYVERAMPSHVLIIGTSPMVNQYVQLARSFSSPGPTPPLNYLNESYMISSQLADLVRGIPGVQGVDARLIIVDNVTGYVKAHFASGGALSGESTNPELIPEAYTGSAQVLIIGVNSSQTIPNWYTSDGFLQPSSPVNIMVAGDSLVGGIVQMPLNLSEVGWLGHRFNVKSVLVDPLNRGEILYTPIQFLQTTFGTNGTNIMLVKADNDPATFSRIEQFTSQNGLAVASEDPILAANLGFLDNTWSYVLLLPILTLALSSGILLSYLTTNYSKRFNDYVVLKVLGAKSWYTFKLLLWEGWGILAICMVIAIPLGFVFSTIFLVPVAQAQALSLMLSAALSVSALTAVSLASVAIYARRLRAMTVKDLRF